ncbi:MAG: glycosyltransferase family 4 protein [Gemmatimonadota bacterium]
MRILVINWQDWTHPRAGGAELHLREVFGRIAAAGHRVDLLCTSHPDAPPEERIDGINVIRRGRSWELFNYAVPGIYRRVLRRNDYDVLVDDLNKVPFYSPLFSNRPVVALVHHLFGSTVFEQTNPVFGGYVWLSERAIARVYRRSPFIAVSRSTALDLERRGVDPGRITVIPNGLPDEDFDRWLTEPKEETPLFVVLTRLKRYKAVEVALEAFAHVLRAHPEARLIVAGDGDHRGALERRAAVGGLDERVAFPGWLDDDAKWSLLRRAWALLYTSPKEGWGISSLEAQRVGTIAIVSDSPGLRDTVVDGETGLVVPHGDVGALAGAMERAIDRPEERATLEAAAVQRARRFSWATAAKQTLEVLESAAGEGES